MSGAAQLAEYIFKKRVRIGRPHGLVGLPDTMTGPDFAVAAGLIKQVLGGQQEVISGPPDLSGKSYRTRRYAGGGFSKSIKWLKENF